MRKFIKYLILICVSIPLTYGCKLLIRAFVVDEFSIPTESMYPTLKPGDKILVNKLLFGARIYTDFDFNLTGQELHCWRTKGLRPIRRNDIVVFNFPHHDNMFSFVINNVFCKRVVALPGDSLSIVNGHYVNNNVYTKIGGLGIDEEQSKLAAAPDSVFPQHVLNCIPYDSENFGWTIRNFGPMYIPRKGDKVSLTASDGPLYWMLISWETGRFITWDWTANTLLADGKSLRTHTFKHNYYFMAGDNVMDSSDSRYWGLVPEEFIVGVVDRVINPWSVTKKNVFDP